MLSISSRLRIFAAVESIDFRKGFDGLVQIVRDRFHQDLTCPRWWGFPLGWERP